MYTFSKRFSIYIYKSSKDFLRARARAKDAATKSNRKRKSDAHTAHRHIEIQYNTMSSSSSHPPPSCLWYAAAVLQVYGHLYQKIRVRHARYRNIVIFTYQQGIARSCHSILLFFALLPSSILFSFDCHTCMAFDSITISSPPFHYARLISSIASRTIPKMYTSPGRKREWE